jgi:tetratricopeptide (TPR) repeat protein
MSQKIIIAATALFSAIVSIPANAENFNQLSQLLSTKECVKCDLSGTGLVMADLAGAKLSSANLSQANLSQANLSGADLSGADLSGASLYGANLTGANLKGAKFERTDLRSAYLNNANLDSISLENAQIQGTRGLIEYAGTSQQFYRWGMTEAEKGHYQIAIEHYTRALDLDPKQAPSYLARGLAFYKLGREQEATHDGQAAAKLFQMQQNLSGYQNSQKFLTGMKLAKTPQVPGNSPLEKFFSGVGSFLLQLLL